MPLVEPPPAPETVLAATLTVFTCSVIATELVVVVISTIFRAGSVMMTCAGIRQKLAV
jgi:hypothetical protein